MVCDYGHVDGFLCHHGNLHLAVFFSLTKIQIGKTILVQKLKKTWSLFPALSEFQRQLKRNSAKRKKDLKLPMSASH